MKRFQNNNVHHSDQIKRRKIKIKAADRNCLVIHFEDFSNEILYEIIEYLDFFHVYLAFFDLNIRFKKLLNDLNLPIKMNLSSISKSDFQRYYTHIIIPHEHQISSFRITNLLSFDLDISPHRILSTFHRLETLILENIKSNYLENVLNDIASLPNLSSLIIIPVDDVENANHHLLQIIRLSVLKYCKISFANNSTEYHPLPFSTNEYSRLEKLVLKDHIHLDKLHRLLSYVPHLRRLSLDYLHEDYRYRFDHPIALNSLTHLFLVLTHVEFDQCELLIQNSFYSIQVLHLLVKDRTEYLNANRWEQLIISYMSNLRVFDIQCNYRYVRNSIAQLENENRLNQFTSLFWFERKWFFAYQDYFKYGYHYITFYSVKPYRKKDYKFEKKPNKANHLDNQETSLSSVHHIHISDEEAILDCLNHFPNATDLILKNISFQKTDLFINTLKYIIPLQNLTKLIMECEDYLFRKLIELLSLTPNIHTLKIPCVTFDRKDFLAIQNSDSFRLVSNTNIIKSLIIKQINEIEKVELLFMLCPRLQQFTIEERWNRIEELLRLLLSKNNDNTRHLFSLCISNENKRLPNKLDTLIQGGKLLDDYFIKSDYPKLYLWW